MCLQTTPHVTGARQSLSLAHSLCVSPLNTAEVVAELYFILTFEVDVVPFSFIA